VRTDSGAPGGRAIYGKATVYKRDVWELFTDLPRLADECDIFYVRFNDPAEMSDDELRAIVKMQVRPDALRTFVREKLDKDGPHFCPYYHRAGVKWDGARFAELCDSLIGEEKLAPIPVLQSNELPDSESLRPTDAQRVGAPAPGPCPGGEPLEPPPMMTEFSYGDEDSVTAAERLAAAKAAANVASAAPRKAPVIDGPAFTALARDVLKMPGFQALAYPELISCGSCEFIAEPPRSKLLQPTFPDWVRQMLESDQGYHFAKHPTWGAMCYHLIVTPLIIKASGGFVDKNWASLNRQELDALVSSPDHQIRDKVFRGLSPWMQAVVGSAGYHKAHRARIASYITHYTYFWGGSPCLFNTMSTADNHSHWMQVCTGNLKGEFDGNVSVFHIGNWTKRQQRTTDDPRATEALSAIRLEHLSAVVPLMLGADPSDLVRPTRGEHQRRVSTPSPPPTFVFIPCHHCSSRVRSSPPLHLVRTAG
jgi:hypothetical protein